MVGSVGTYRKESHSCGTEKRRRFRLREREKDQARIHVDGDLVFVESSIKEVELTESNVS